MLERRASRHHRIRSKVHQLARAHLVALTKLVLRDRDALVETLVAELAVVFRAEVIMKELVLMVKTNVADVAESKVGADRHQGERTGDALRPVAAHRLLSRQERRFVDRQRGGAECDARLD